MGLQMPPQARKRAMIFHNARSRRVSSLGFDTVKYLCLSDPKLQLMMASSERVMP